MTDFKGTKTEWQISENSIGFVYALKENGVENAFSFNINNDGHLSDKEISANALLAQKAPALLKALKEANNVLKMASLIDKSNVCETTQLMCEKIIKEATNI